MAEVSKISWTDSTFSPWWGCQVVGPGCDNCYAAALDKRTGGDHWGPGVERRRTSAQNWNQVYKWNRNAEKFFAEHGRRQRVFASSMCDIFDNAVPDDWTAEAFQLLEVNNRLEWQMLTKRVGNVEKRVPKHWKDGGWPQHIGLMITCVNQEEWDRDVPKLTSLQAKFRIPWTGVSYEPAQGRINLDKPMVHPNWVICGGESGAGWRYADIEWFRWMKRQCDVFHIKFFMKQLSGFRPKEEDIPEDLRVRDFPR